jgi:hypothetical protein
MKSRTKTTHMMHQVRKVMFVLLSFFSMAGVAHADGKIVQIALKGDYTHVVNAVSIDVSDDGATATVEIRDPDSNPDTTSTIIIDVETGTVTAHTGSEKDYTGWEVISVWQIEEGQERQDTSGQTIADN